MSTKFAIVTGASTGIGYHLAKLALADGYDVLAVADTPFAHPLGSGPDAAAQTLEVDLSTTDGVDQLLAAAGDRRIDVLCANAGHGLGHAFLDQSVADWRHVVDTNIVGTAYLLQRVLPAMVQRNEGRVLVTSSTVDSIPGPFNAVYNGTKAFLTSFVGALMDELKDADGVRLTILKPGPVDTEFFARAGMTDTSVSDPAKDNKRDPALVAKDGWDALMADKRSVVSGLTAKLQSAMAAVAPDSMLAQSHRGMAEPGTASSN